MHAIADAHCLGIRSRTRLTDAVLEAASKRAAVGAFCIGTDRIDLAAATRRGIPRKDALLHRGGWGKSAAGSFEARGKVPGIVGYGHIGTQVGVLAEQLARMRRGASLVNASRGSVVDRDALAAALESGRLAGAAIDVLPVEPEGTEQRFDTPLARFDDVTLTPHVGGCTLEAQESIGREVAAKLIRYSNNGSTVSAVNFPGVSLPEPAGQCRPLHIHRNVPGMLARIDEPFPRAGIDVAAQYLRTDEHVGYVVMDVDAAARSIALEGLCAIPGTIRCRIVR